MVQVSNGNEFVNAVSDGIVLVDFFATWCSPCKMLARELDKVEGINIVKADIEEVSEIVAQYDIMSVPTLAVFKDGQLLNIEVGYKTSEQVIDFVRSSI